MHGELKAIKRMTIQENLTMVSEAKTLINASEFRPTTLAVQTKKAQSSFKGQIGCVTQQHVGKPLALLCRKYSELVQISCGPFGKLGPEHWVLRLEPEDSDDFQAIEANVIETFVHMRRNHRFAYF
jgi:hypothetical protein